MKEKSNATLKVRQPLRSIFYFNHCTENSRRWTYDTQGTENRSTALVPPQASTALTNNASEEKAKGTPIPALVGFHRKTSLGYRVQDLRIRMAFYWT